MPASQRFIFTGWLCRVVIIDKYFQLDSVTIQKDDFIVCTLFTEASGMMVGTMPVL